jgi:mono/diheme cytochrome c family protein
MTRTQLSTLLTTLAGLVCIGSVSAEDITGKQVYENWCHQCHMPSPFAPGTIQLKHTRGEALSVIENRREFPEEYTRMIVRRGIGGMPNFRRTEITDEELDMLAEYMAGKE